MIIKEVDAKSILDSRKEKTIFVSIKTSAGNFSASSPTGKSTGKFEAKAYKKNLEEDIQALKDFSDYFSKENIDCFEDLRRIEEVVDGHIGANSLFALESAVLKSLAKEKGKEVWELINPKANKIPKFVGNCIGGGKHSNIEGKKPDFQEFLLIPDSNSAIQSFDVNRNAKVDAQIILKNIDEKFKGEKNDENAWISSLDDKRVLEVLKDLKDNAWDERSLYLNVGIDVAASSFCKRRKYNYENPMLKRDRDEQFRYLSNLIKNYNLFYIEDPFEENDFGSFSKLLKKFPDRLIVGDDLIVTNSKRLKKAIEEKSVNAIIVKPNQCGSLLEVARVCELAKKNKIKIIFSHRSGETEENILADLAFGFQADFFKCGIDGKEREAKLRRLIEIEKELK
ncbi:MAG: enolase C-terminal domain-like protein [Candidatus Pacearchaeota archaeon]